MATPLHKRPNDLFVSYGHGDRAVVDPLVNWLRKSAGLKLWYDVSSGGAAQRTTERLARGTGNAAADLRACGDWLMSAVDAMPASSRNVA